MLKFRGNMPKNYLKMALRNFKKQKFYSLIIIGGLAIGMACTFLILSWVQEELSYDQFHKKKNEIFRVIIDWKDGQSAGTCGALAPALKDEIPEIMNFTRVWIGGEWQIHYKENNLSENSLYADPSFFEIFSFPLIVGETNSMLMGSHDVVVTKTLAEKLFGNDDPLGKIIYINNRFNKEEAFHIAGVIGDIPQNSHIQFDFLFSYNLLREWYRPDFGEAWSNYSFATYVLLQMNSDIANINRKIIDCYNRHRPLNPQKLQLQPLSDVYLYPEIKNYLGPIGSIKYVKIFIIIALFVMLIACINFINLSTALSIRHAKEVGLRKVFGAYKKQIACQYLTEACVFALAALPIAYLLVELARQPFHNITGRDLTFSLFDPALIVGALFIVFLTGLVAGSYPAWYLSSFHPAATLKGMVKSGRTKILIRGIFIVIQFSLSIIIITTTFVISRQMKFIQKKDLGFAKENLLYTWTPGFQNEVIRNELLKNPNVIQVGASGSQLDKIAWRQKIRDWSGRQSDDEASINILEVGYHYLETYKMEMADGRYYSEKYFTDATDAIIINEAAVKAMKIESPIGITMNVFGRSQTIIGVVKNFNFASLHKEIEPLALVLYPKQLRCLGIRLKSENMAETINYIKKVMKKALPDYVLEYHFLDQQLDKLYIAENQRAELFGSFSFISIFLSCLGLFGLASFTAERRKKEFGIRRVVGASIDNLVFIQLKEIFYLVVISNMIAWPVTYFFMNEWLQNFAYRIGISWRMFFLPGGIVLLIAFATVSFQAIKAAMANPIESLRYE